MLINRLNLINFRNYKELYLSDLAKPRVIIIGNNAQGKTNLIEAIHMMAFGSSYRAKKDLEVISWDNHEAGIYSELLTSFSTKELNIILRKRGAKTLKVDGNRVKKLAEFVGNIKVVLFSAEDLNLIKGAPSERRSFIDKLLVQVYPRYYHKLQVYNKIIKQKNSLLKKLKETNSKSMDILSILNEQLVDISIDIYILRYGLIEKLVDLIKGYHSEISNNNETITIDYLPSITFQKDLLEDREQLKTFFIDHLNTNSFKEIIRGQSLYGPHRDDILFLINGKEAKFFGSQGQQRTLVLAIKLSEINYIKELTKEIPILLLDDVMAELDKNRQKQLLEMVGSETQTFITTTHLEYFSDKWLDNSILLEVDNGTVSRNN